MATLSTEDSAPGGRCGPRRPRRDRRARPRRADRVEAPDLRKLGDALRDRVEVRSVAITGLFVLAVFYTLYFARAFFLPIVLAILLDFLLSPVIRAAQARSASRSPWGPRCVLLTLLGGLGGGRLHAGRAGAEWVAKAPQSISQVQGRLRELRRPVEQVTRTAEQVEAATEVEPQRARRRSCCGARG